MATIIAHNSVAHHHHDDIEPFLQHELQHHHNSPHEHNHHDENDKQHNAFSFTQLDEDFLPSQYGKMNIDLPVLYLLTPAITFQLSSLRERSKVQPNYREEIPPPLQFSSDLFSRPPPAC